MVRSIYWIRRRWRGSIGRLEGHSASDPSQRLRAQHQGSSFPGVTVEVELRDRVPSCARERGATYPLRFTTAHAKGRVSVLTTVLDDRHLMQIIRRTGLRELKSGLSLCGDPACDQGRGCDQRSQPRPSWPVAGHCKRSTTRPAQRLPILVALKGISAGDALLTSA